MKMGEASYAADLICQPPHSLFSSFMALVPTSISVLGLVHGNRMLESEWNKLQHIVEYLSEMTEIMHGRIARYKLGRLPRVTVTVSRFSPPRITSMAISSPGRVSSIK